MYDRLMVSFSLFVLCLSIVSKINGISNDELKNQAREHHRHAELHQKSHHHVHQKSHENQHKGEEKHYFYHSLGLHQGRHHKGIKTRHENGSSCTNICVDEQLAAVAKWLNGTRELKLLFSLIPPCGGCGFTIPNISIPIPVNSNTTLPYPIGANGTYSLPTTFPLPILNVTLPPPGSNVTLPFPSINVTVPNLPIPNPINGTYNATTEFPILSYLGRLLGRFLATFERISDLIAAVPIFGIIWREILWGISIGACGKTDIIVRNLGALFGCNGTFGANLFNFTHWEHVLSPWNISNVAHDIIHDIESLIPHWG